MQHHPSNSPSAFLTAPSPSPFLTAHSPAHPPRPSPARAHPPPTLTSTRAGLTVDDPTVEAARTVGVLLGTQTGGVGKEGLLDRVEKEVEQLLTAYERAFEAGEPAAGTGSPLSSLPSLQSLLSLLSRSSVGGFIPPQPSSAPPEGLPPPTLSQSHIDAAGSRVGELFKEVQRVREAGEVGRVGLTG
ncbi:hypothetical protein JCM11251_006539 [Rhodosporidiobolus azoricus]